MRLVKINPSVVLAIHLQEPLIASVMELVDVPDSKSGAARRVGSSPTRGTTNGFFNGSDQHHIDILGETNLLYDQTNVMEKILSIKDIQGNYRELVDKFNPTVVMNKFNKVFLRK
jgi:hypothetical protein